MTPSSQQFNDGGEVRLAVVADVHANEVAMMQVKRTEVRSERCFGDAAHKIRQRSPSLATSRTQCRTRFLGRSGRLG